MNVHAESCQSYDCLTNHMTAIVAICSLASRSAE